MALTFERSRRTVTLPIGKSYKTSHLRLSWVLGAMLMFGACGVTNLDSSQGTSDSTWAFGKDEDALSSLEHHCLNVARTYCDGLMPCCAEINVPIEREICINQAADKCYATDLYEIDMPPEGREICLERATSMFMQCSQQTSNVIMPIDLRHQLRCEDQWPVKVEAIPTAVGEGEQCDDVDGLANTRNVPCESGLHCSRESGSETTAPRFCRPLVEQGGTCVYGNECIAGTVCDGHICEALLPLGAQCDWRYRCESGACCNGVCVVSPAMDAHLCWIYTWPGRSVPNALSEGTICDSIEYNDRGRAGEDVLYH